MIELSDSLGLRLKHHATLYDAYHGVRKPWHQRNAWLLATVAPLVVMFAIGVIYYGVKSDALPPWLDSVTGNLVLSGLGGVFFLFVGLWISERTKAGVDEALAANLYERMSIEAGIDQLKSGEVIDISVPYPLSGPDLLLYQVVGVTGPDGQLLKRDGAYVMHVTDHPRLSNSREYKEAYELSKVKPDTHYFARWQDRSWHMSPRLYADNWTEFRFSGQAARMVVDTTADEVVASRAT